MIVSLCLNVKNQPKLSNSDSFDPLFERASFLNSYLRYCLEVMRIMFRKKQYTFQLKFRISSVWYWKLTILGILWPNSSLVRIPIFARLDDSTICHFCLQLSAFGSCCCLMGWQRFMRFILQISQSNLQLSDGAILFHSYLGFWMFLVSTKSDFD